jgi:hypothetical protein
MSVKLASKDLNYAIPHAACIKCAAFILSVVNFTRSLRQDKNLTNLKFSFHNHTSINLTLLLGIEQPRFLNEVVAHLQYSGKWYKH